MTDELLDGLVTRIQSLQQLMEAQLPVITSEIDAIINQSIQDPQRIERVLDTLLDYAHISVGEDEFKRLNGYYATFNEENASFYQEFYEEMFDEEKKE